MGIDRAASREQPELLDTKKALQLLILSFKFSQGAVYLQRLLFRWLHSHYPQFKLLNYESLASEFSEAVTTFLTDGKLHKAQLEPPAPANQKIIMAAQDMAQIMQEELDGKQTDIPEFPSDPSAGMMPPAEILPKIVGYIISKDYNYLTAKGGRPSTGKRRDLYFSHLCHYGLLGRSTNSPEFDALFTAIKKHIQGGNLDPISEEVLEQLIMIHNQHYPDKKINVKLLLRYKKLLWTYKDRK